MEFRSTPAQTPHLICHIRNHSQPLKCCWELVPLLPLPHSAIPVCTVPLKTIWLQRQDWRRSWCSHSRQNLQPRDFYRQWGKARPRGLRTPRPRPSLIFAHERLIKLAIPYRVSFEIAGDKGLTLSPDIVVREVRSSLAMIGFSVVFKLLGPFDFA